MDTFLKTIFQDRVSVLSCFSRANASYLVRKGEEPHGSTARQELSAFAKHIMDRAESFLRPHGFGPLARKAQATEGGTDA